MDSDLRTAISNISVDTKGIMDSEEYFNSVVLLLLTKIEDEYHIVIQKRSPNIRQGGELCLPGGGIEPDESPVETVCRETSEELGIPQSAVQILARLDTVVAALGAIVHVYVGYTDLSPDQFCINPHEVQEVYTLPLYYLLKQEPEVYELLVKAHPLVHGNSDSTGLLPSKELDLPEIYHQPWGNFRQKVYVYRESFGVIWGITAKILRNFTKIMKSTSWANKEQYHGK